MDYSREDGRRTWQDRAGGGQERWERPREGGWRQNHRSPPRKRVNYYPHQHPGGSEKQSWRSGESDQADRQESGKDDRDSTAGKEELFIDRSKFYHPLLEGVLLEKAVTPFWPAVDLDLRFKYFQDRNKVWPFWCKQDGAALLYRVLGALVPCLNESANEDPRVLWEGEQLYSQKPNLGGQGVAWSQEEYNHPGLQRQYVRFKSVQRFTETWSTLERAYNWGMFSLENFDEDREEPFRVASLGGGPGFELLAVEEFVKWHLPKRSREMELYSLDIEPSWERYTRLLGLKFAVWDVNDGAGLLSKCPSYSDKAPQPPRENPLDLAIISYVYSHYMSNTHCYDWLADALKSGRIAAVLVCSRQERMPQHVRPMAERGIAVLSVLQKPPGNPHDPDIDHRQLLFLPQEKTHMLRQPADIIHDLTFPNVPYCEHKKGRKR